MLYERIKELSKKKGVSITKTEHDLGFGRGSLSKIDKHKPNIDKLQKIADYFGVSVDYLLGVQNSGPQTDPEWYINNETGEAAQEVFDDPDLRLLFDAARDSRPEDLQMAADLLRRLKKTNQDD